MATVADDRELDTLDLLLRDVGRHRLLTRAEEVALAKRAERGLTRERVRQLEEGALEKLRALWPPDIEVRTPTIASDDPHFPAAGMRTATDAARLPALDTRDRMSVDPQIPATAAALIAGYLMTVAGLHKRLLQWRRPPRRCPSCRHVQSECICREGERRRTFHLWGLR